MPASPKRRAPSIDPVTEYARSVIAGRIPACKWVKLACKRHLDDLKSGAARGLVFHAPSANYAIEFFKFLKHSKGEWGRSGGLIFELELWQKFIVGSVFGWYRADGTRRFRVVYEEIPRKNGKSTKLAGIGLYGLVADDEPGAEIYAAATKRDQARIIFDEAKRMARKSEDLRSAGVNVFNLNLSIDRTASKFEPISSDARTLDGLNPHFVLVDELHKHRNRNLLDVLDTALGSRRQPLLWIITTAGDEDPESIYAQENDYAMKILEGTLEDDDTFAYIATIDKDDRWDDPIAWAKANPNLGVSVKLDDLKRQALKAKNSPGAQTSFKRLRLNVRTAAADSYIDMNTWAKNSQGRFDPASLAGRPCFGALDLSSKIDISAWIKLFPPLAPKERWMVTCNFWIPATNVEDREDRDRAPYSRWIEEGWIEATPGDIIDHQVIEDAVMEDIRQFDIRNIPYDPWNATQMAVRLTENGVQMCEFIQGIRSYTAPSKELQAMLIAHTIDHGDNPVLRWMASNLKVVEDKNKNVMPSKKHSVKRIDGMTALIMAIGASMNQDPGSMYEKAGLTVFG